MDVEWVKNAPIDGFDTHRAIRFRVRAQFHPLKYLRGFGGRHCSPRWTDFHRDKGRGSAWRNDARASQQDQIEYGDGEAVVVATNSPDQRPLRHSHEAGALYDLCHWTSCPAWRRHARFVLGHGGTGREWRPVRGPVAIPLCSRCKRRRAGNEILIVGGEDHKTGQADDFEQRFQRLEDWARARWPKAGEVVFQWSGQVMEPVDGLGFIGRNPVGRRQCLHCDRRFRATG